MPIVLNALPYFERPTKAIAPGVSENVKAFQIVLWVSLAPAHQFDLPENASRFPAILDTGNSDSFAIKPSHLRQWTGSDLSAFAEDGFRLHGDIEIPTRRANLWLHPNMPNEGDTFNLSMPPFPVDLHDGITVYGDGEQVGKDDRTKTVIGPRLLLLGLRALTRWRCELRIDCDQRVVFLSVPDSI